MGVGRETVGVIQGTHAQKAHGLTGPGVMTPQGDAAAGAAGDLLPLAAVGRGVDDFDLALQQLQPVSLYEGIQGEGRTGLALAPAAVAAMHEQGRGRHAIAHGVAGAAAVEVGFFGVHADVISIDST